MVTASGYILFCCHVIDQTSRVWWSCATQQTLGILTLETHDVYEKAWLGHHSLPEVLVQWGYYGVIGTEHYHSLHQVYSGTWHISLSCHGQLQGVATSPAQWQTCWNLTVFTLAYCHKTQLICSSPWTYQQTSQQRIFVSDVLKIDAQSKWPSN